MKRAPAKKVAAKKAPAVELPARFAALPRVGAPSPEQVRRARLKVSLTQVQAAALLYVDADTWRQYEKSKDQNNARQMRPALWELFLLKIGDIAPDLYNPPKLTFERVDAGMPPPKPTPFRRAAP